jgi:hypothetical protein
VFVAVSVIFGGVPVTVSTMAVGGEGSSSVDVTVGVSGTAVDGVSNKRGSDCAACQPEPGEFPAITAELVTEKTRPVTRNRIPPANKMRINILK